MDKITEELRTQLKESLKGRVKGFFIGDLDFFKIPNHKFPAISVYVNSITATTKDFCTVKAVGNIVIQISVPLGRALNTNNEMKALLEMLAIVSGRDLNGNLGKNTVLGVLSKKQFLTNMGGFRESGITFTYQPANREGQDTLEGFVSFPYQFFSQTVEQLNN